jgi:triphosphoribosyl-dephospho-CoA synthase
MASCELCERIKRSALKALVHEVSITPKPGLVDQLNNGSHQDMNLYTFIKSAMALQQYFYDCAFIGLENHQKSEEDIFPKLRERGKKADKDMLEATNGVNTHKGAIFSLGLLSAAAAFPYNKQRDFSEQSICKNAGKLCERIFELDFSDKFIDELTSGQKIYRLHGVTGIRGEAKNGFPTITNHAYPYLIKLLQEGNALNEAGVNVLLEIIIHSQDTNLIARGGIEGLEYAKERARKALSMGGMLTPEGKKEIINMDKAFIRKRLSPGGSADLLAATLMLYFLIHDIQSE